MFGNGHAALTQIPLFGGVIVAMCRDAKTDLTLCLKTASEEASLCNALDSLSGGVTFPNLKFAIDLL